MNIKKNTYLLFGILGICACALVFRACTSLSLLAHSDSTTAAANSTPSPSLSAQKPTPWWNSSWKYRQKLLFNNKNQVEDLTDFPVLIHLTEQNFDFSLAEKKLINPLGNDLRFIAEDGKTVLPYEIEQWSVASKSASIWVKVPKIRALTNQDHITMYSGNPAVSAGEQKQIVWDKHFISVWHMSDYPIGELFGTAKDSTVFAKDLLKTGPRNDVISATSSAALGKSVQFLTGQSVQVDSHPELISGSLSGSGDFAYYRFDASEDFSVSVWVRPLVPVFDTGVMQVLGNLSSCCGQVPTGWGLRINNTKLIPTYFQIRQQNISTTLVQNVSLLDDDWHFLAVTRRKDFISLFFDNQLVQTTRLQTPGLFLSMIDQTGTSGFNTHPFNLGGDTQINRYFGYHGFIDEARVSRSGRSLSWFQAEYLNGLDQFVNYEEPALTVVVPDKKLSTTDLNLDITFTTQPSPADATMSAHTLAQIFSATPSATRIPLNFQGIKDKRATWKGTVKIPKAKLGQYQHFQGSVELLKKNQSGAISTHFVNLQDGYTNLGTTFDFSVDLNTASTQKF